MVANFGVDNGIFVWLNGNYEFGALAGGGPVPGEYSINLGDLTAGTHYLQLLLEDHGGSNGYIVDITANQFTPGHPRRPSQNPARLPCSVSACWVLSVQGAAAPTNRPARHAKFRRRSFGATVFAYGRWSRRSRHAIVPPRKQPGREGMMVHLSAMPEHLRDALVNQELPEFGAAPWVAARPLAESRVAIISTAGLHRAEDSPFVAGAGDYRIIPDDTDTDTLLMSHVPTNFDRTGFFQDVNTSFPINRLHDLVDDGIVGSAATRHYSFMGATPPTAMEPVARDLAGLLKQDRVDAVLLVPV